MMLEIYRSSLDNKITVICSRCSRASSEGEKFCCDEAMEMYAEYFLPALLQRVAQ